jgi:dihydroorotate dehydrogenase
MIDLAPRNKRGLVLQFPLIAGSGAVGLADPWPDLIPKDLFAAVVTAPFSRAPRRGTGGARLAELPAGFVLNTGDHNPGYARSFQAPTDGWRRLNVPVIVALAQELPGDLAAMAEVLEEDRQAAGLQISLPSKWSLNMAKTAVAGVRHACTLPLLVELPFERVLSWAEMAASAGADALLVATPPVATAPAANGEMVSGPIGGPAAFPFTRHALFELLDLNLGTEVPVVASGGICRIEWLREALGLVQAAAIRSIVWRNPAVAVEMGAYARSV